MTGSDTTPSDDSTEKLSQRIPFGEEEQQELSDGTPIYLPPVTNECHDCGAGEGELHTPGCDVEQCPECGLQLIGCEHGSVILDG